MYKENLLNVSYALKEQLVMSLYESDNCLIGSKNNVEYRILIIANQIELSAHVLYNTSIPEGWYIPFVMVLNDNFNLKVVIKESYDVDVVNEKIQVDVYREDEETSEEDITIEEEDIDDSSLENFDPMEYATSSMVGGGNFIRYSKEYFGEDAKVKTPEIVIEEQKAEGLRDTTDELTNPEPDKSLLDRLKEEMEKLSDEEQKELLEEVGIESIEELFEDEVKEEPVDFTELVKEEIDKQLSEEAEEKAFEEMTADERRSILDKIYTETIEEIFEKEMEKAKIEEKEIPDLVLADSSDFEMDDYFDEDEDDDLLEF